MICGKMEIVSGPYGPTSTCQPIDPDAVDRFGKPLLETQIDTAMQHLTATLTKAEIPVQEESGEESVFRLHKQSNENRAPECGGLEQAA